MLVTIRKEKQRLVLMTINFKSTRLCKCPEFSQQAEFSWKHWSINELSVSVLETTETKFKGPTSTSRL